jgi:IEC3 subunit of the Ino80 complex, chromatin re-modelling
MESTNLSDRSSLSSYFNLNLPSPWTAIKTSLSMTRSTSFQSHSPERHTNRSGKVLCNVGAQSLISRRRKYRKIMVVFEDRMRESNTLYREHQRILDISRRLSEQNEYFSLGFFCPICANLLQANSSSCSTI